MLTWIRTAVARVVALVWAAVALLVVTAWYGGSLVYEYGEPERPA